MDLVTLMDVGLALYFVTAYFILFYYVIGGLLYAFFNYWGLLHINRFSRFQTDFALRSTLESHLYEPISLLVPAYNEELSIVASVRSFLNLHHPVFEIIVVSDGSKDRTIDVLVEAYQLVEVPFYLYRETIATRPVRRMFRSREYESLIVLEKDNGGKSDAVNAALNVARYPLVCVVDADSVLDTEALIHASQLFVEDPTVIAVGGTVRPLNGATIHKGKIKALHIPDKWIERLQILEYNRAFFSGRAGWAAINALLIISGAFGVFRREVVLTVGGYSAQTVTEDMELVVRLHKYHLKRKIPYQVLFIPDPMCWTEVPSDWRTLRRQRNRWHRGLLETLWMHRSMTFNPRYGRLGLLAIPYFWFYEAFSPLVEMLGYGFLIWSILSGTIDWQFAFWFLLLAVLFGTIISQLAALVEGLLVQRYERLSDRILLLLLGLVEFVGYRQILVWERFQATFQIASKRGQWGAMRRRGIG
jgi:cellulose synthase/poly-beta-1,6-N-acetylglucosamine synthase-like glycosyltransferase